MSSTNYSKRERFLRFGEWLRKLRADRDLPLRSVAAAAGMDQAVLSKIELGQRVPTEEQTADLAKFFGVNVTAAQARRIAEKFHQETLDRPKIAREAICFLAEEAGIYSTQRRRIHN